MQRFTINEKRILILTGYGHFLSHFNMLVFPAILIPLTQSLNMDMAQVLGLAFWMYLLFGITALPWGMAADRWGARPLLMLFYVGAGICGVLGAFSISSPTGLTFALSGLGLFSGIYHPAALGLISTEINRVSMAMGYNGMMGNLGLAAAPLMAGLINWLWGAKMVYIFVAGMNFSGIGLILLTTSHKREEKESRPNADERANGNVPAFFILLMAMMLGGVAYRGATVTLPAYFEMKTPELFQWIASFENLKVSKNLVATSITSIIYIIGMAGQFAGGRSAEKIDLRLGYLIAHAITIPAVFCMSFAAELPLIMLGVVYIFFLLGMQPIENTLVTQYTPKALRHSAFGLKFVLAFGVASLAVKGVEHIETHYSIEMVFPALASVSLLLVGAIVLLFWITKKKSHPQAHDGK